VQAPVIGRVIKGVAGMASAREMPAFAPQTFRDWFSSRPSGPRGHRPRVLLWPDTFNNHFHPETLRAGVEVIEAMGYDVALPPPSLCCGRPLYDFGLLSVAQRRLEEILAAMAEEIRAGTLVVGLEPGCLSVFRDELTNLLPHSEQAQRLKEQTVTFAELVARSPDALRGVRFERRALVHGHCHHKAVVQMDADRAVLERLGVRHDILDAGCCGMAGAFGFEADHYDISLAIGERVLLPAVRAAARDTLIVADGFSCREQIAQATDRRALHLAEVVHLALLGGRQGPPGDLPERARAIDHREARLERREWAGVALLAAGAALAVGSARWRRGRSRVDDGA
jgi:Fe-S oxidoreductase